MTGKHEGEAGPLMQPKTHAKSFTVAMPVMTNPLDIPADTELILKWTLKEKPDRAPKQTSWVEEVQAVEKRRRLQATSDLKKRAKKSEM